MMKYSILLSILLLAACNEEPVDKTVWDEQLKTMDKARDVEKQVLDAAELQRQQIEQNSNQ
ncbi:hypothetical protein [Methylophaga thiooxydans]|uniref:hypothetical protein n=1 Tax=Methylophaga thiooxydans TaxID=392484 RepID=UPI002357B526|nr:hypothetical protein [Methylophaga thiooxydans]